jgi:cobyrinic acid a,c-diamide synthase
VLHPAAVIRSLVRPGRLVVVDEAFLDAVPGEPETLAGEPGVLVLRSLTKHWSIPGIRAGYAIGEPGVIAGLAALQAPWSVSSPAIAAMVAIAGAAAESAWRARELTGWREHLEAGLRDRGLAFPVSAAPFVLTRAGAGVHAALRGQGVAVRRGGTFPGLDDSWVRIAARPPEQTGRLLEALDKVHAEPRA